MPIHHDDELPTLDLADLARVTGGAADAMSSMLPMLMMMKSRSAGAAAVAAPAPAPAPAPAWTPRILVDGVEQPVTSSANGTTFTTST
jgi:hypothetical protein